MPIWLRKFTFHKIEKWYSDESEAINKANQGNSTQVVSADGKVNVPELLVIIPVKVVIALNLSPVFLASCANL